MEFSCGLIVIVLKRFNNEMIFKQGGRNKTISKW